MVSNLKEAIKQLGSMLTTKSPKQGFRLSANSGYLIVRQEDGTLAYAQSAIFHVNDSGYIANEAGQILLKSDGVPIAPEAIDFNVTADGTITFTNVSGQVNPTGSVIIAAKFKSPDQLKGLGNGFFIVPDGADAGIIEDKPLGSSLPDVSLSFEYLNNPVVLTNLENGVQVITDVCQILNKVITEIDN